LAPCLNELHPPAQLLAVVHVAGNGEFFWPRDKAAEAAQWLSGLSFAVTGGEVYRGFRGAWATYVGEWTTTPSRLPTEAWATYVERGLSQAIDRVNTETGEDEDLYFFAYRCPNDDDLEIRANETRPT
jgi:hypothetical protein